MDAKWSQICSFGRCLVSNPTAVVHDLPDRSLLHVEAGSDLDLGHPARVQNTHFIRDCVIDLCSLATAQVLTMRDWLKMIWSDAGRIATKVIQFQSVRNRSVCSFPGNSVGQLPAPKATVSQRILFPKPEMADCLISQISFFPKTVTPFGSWLNTRVVSVNKSFRFPLDPTETIVCTRGDGRRVPASAFAEFGSRLRIHVGLLRGLTLRGSGWYRSPILLGWAV